jgi:hypothetical protein
VLQAVLQWCCNGVYVAAVLLSVLGTSVSYAMLPKPGLVWAVSYRVQLLHMFIAQVQADGPCRAGRNLAVSHQGAPGGDYALQSLRGCCMLTHLLEVQPLLLHRT